MASSDGDALVIDVIGYDREGHELPKVIGAR